LCIYAELAQILPNWELECINASQQIHQGWRGSLCSARTQYTNDSLMVKKQQMIQAFVCLQAFFTENRGRASLTRSLPSPPPVHESTCVLSNHNVEAQGDDVGPL